MNDFERRFRESYGRALGNDSYQPGFIGSFYQRLMARSPEIAHLFRNTNMTAQKVMLHDSLHMMVDFFVEQRITPVLERIARVHGRSDRNIPPHLYAEWLDALIDTVRDFDPQFDEDTELAWRLVLAPGIAYMQFAGSRTPVRTPMPA